MFKKDNWIKIFFILIIVIFPGIIFTELKPSLIGWGFIIIYFALLLTILHYHAKVFQKNNVIKELDEKFQLTSKLKAMKHEQRDFEIRRLIEEITDSIIHVNKNS